MGKDGEKMPEKENRLQEMRALIDQLNQWALEYYTYDNASVSDREYDRAYDRLSDLEKETGTVLSDSPTKRVGGEVLEGFEKHRHLAPLYSLGKLRTREEVEAWAARCQKAVEDYNQKNPKAPLPDLLFLVELKFDGLTINLTYNQGKLELATTRGNGEVGEMVLAQIRTIRSIPLKIPYQGRIEVQGEGLMPYSSLEEYNKTAEIPLKNPRNGAAGAIRNLDPGETAARRLDAYIYNVGYSEEPLFTDQLSMFQFLRDNHFRVHPYLKVCRTIPQIMDAIDEIGKFRHDLDVATDGVVIKINDLKTREFLGFTAKFPRWAMAYKYEAEERTTILREVRWNVGRTGKLTPTALVDPVELSGATVSRATLNNFDDIQRKGLELGASVLIRRSNEVIPEILGVVPDPARKTQPIEKPKFCPACGSELVQENVHIYCPNSLSCLPQLVARLTHFASRAGMDIEGLSEKTLELFISRGLREMADLYKLKEKDLLSLKGFKEKKTQNLLEAIENSKNPPLDRFLNALGIPEVGEAAARDLAGHFKSLENLRKAGTEDLEELADIGPVTAYNIVEFFHDPHISSSLDRLLAQGVRPKEVQDEEQGPRPLEGKSVVVTGTMEGFTRQQMEEGVRRLGGQARGSVSKKTDLLLAGEAPGSKRDKAQALGVKIIEGEELAAFLKKYFSKA